MCEHSMASAQPSVEGVGEGEGGLGEQGPRIRSRGKVIARRDVRVSLSHTVPRGETTMEPPKRPRVQGDLDEMFNRGSGSRMQKTSSLPSTPRELSPVDEVMLDSQEEVRDYLIFEKWWVHVFSPC